MQSLNQAILAGNIGGEIKNRTAGQSTVTNFSLATSYGKKQADGTWNDVTTWHNIAVWGVSERLLPLLGKGAKVLVRGRIDNREFEDQNGNKRRWSEVVANASDLMLISPAKDAPAQGSRAPQRSAPADNAIKRYGSQSTAPVQTHMPPQSTAADDGTEIPFAALLAAGIAFAQAIVNGGFVA